MTDIDIDDLRADPARTSDPVLKVEPGEAPLPVGRHTFRLTVTDDSGNVSQPADVSVIVVDTQAPTAVLEVRDSRGRAVPDNRVSFGATFRLDARKSVDAGGGQIATYKWQLVD